MERSEHIKLQAARRRLDQALSAVDEIIRTAAAPTRLSSKEIRERAQAIARDVGALKRPASTTQLRGITAKRGMRYSAVGALYAGAYLRRTKAGITPGQRGDKVNRAKRARAPPRQSKRSK